MNGQQGVRFSHNYIPKGEPTSDSKRMRLRVARLFEKCRPPRKFEAESLELALGVAVPWSVGGYRDWEKFFLQCEMRDLLDTISIFAKALLDAGLYGREEWLQGVTAIFAEENVHYRLDSLGGVHFAIDAQFEHNQACAIAALQAPRYAAARAHFEAGQNALDGNPPQTREA